MPPSNDPKSKFHKQRKDKKPDEFDLDKKNTKGEISNIEIKKGFSLYGVSFFKKPNKQKRIAGTTQKSRVKPKRKKEVNLTMKLRALRLLQWKSRIDGCVMIMAPFSCDRKFQPHRTLS